MLICPKYCCKMLADILGIVIASTCDNKCNDLECGVSTSTDWQNLTPYVPCQLVNWKVNMVGDRILGQLTNS